MLLMRMQKAEFMSWYLASSFCLEMLGFRLISFINSAPAPHPTPPAKTIASIIILSHCLVCVLLFFISDKSMLFQPQQCLLFPQVHNQIPKIYVMSVSKHNLLQIYQCPCQLYMLLQHVQGM